MPIFRIKQKNVLFVHIPKTGGETVERYLGQHSEIGFFHPWMNQTYYQCTPQHFDAEMLAPLFPASFIDYRFAFIRHPLDRLVSAYKMRMGRRFRNGDDFPEFDEWFTKFSTILDTKPRVLDNHLNKQSAFIEDTTKVFRFEDGIIDNLKQVQDDLGVTFDFSRNIHRQKSHSDIQVTISDDHITRIAEFYAEDFAAFNYELDAARYFAK